MTPRFYATPSHFQTSHFPRSGCRIPPRQRDGTMAKSSKSSNNTSGRARPRPSRHWILTEMPTFPQAENPPGTERRKRRARLGLGPISTPRGRGQTRPVFIQLTRWGTAGTVWSAPHWSCFRRPMTGRVPAHERPNLEYGASADFPCGVVPRPIRRGGLPHLGGLQTTVRALFELDRK